MKILVYLFSLLICASVVSSTALAFQGEWKTYKGAYFDVRYPASFSARGSQRTDGERYDSAFFRAPDGSVEFYIFSPIWNGDPQDIEINEATESYVSQKTETRNGIKVRRVTISGKDGSYLRSFEDTEDTNTNTRKVFGIKYKDQSAYNKYRQTYLTFKQSLKQYAD